MKLFFCFPEKKIGGVSILFLRVSNALSKKFSRDTYLIDYKDGYMAQNLDEEDKLIPYNPFVEIDLEGEKSNENILIFQSMTPWSIFNNIISENARVIFWTCHPNNFIPDLSFLNFFGDRAKKLFLKTFLFQYYKKSQILDLELLASSFSFDLKIIGDGPYLKNLISLKSKVSYEIHFENEIKANQLDNYLINNCSILFAMGTAALEGAKLGIPTVLLDISYKKISKEYNYRWLYERDGMTLGENIN